MHKKIVLKTDASYKNDMGVGIAYEAIVYDHGAYDRYTGSKYIPKQVKTTDAEMAAAIFGLKETYKKIDEHHPQYELVLRSDCEHVVLKINEGLPDKEKNETIIRILYTPIQRFQSYVDTASEQY